MGKQVYCPRDFGPHNTGVIRNMGLEQPEGTFSCHGKDWLRHQACRHDTFSLVALETSRTRIDNIGYTRQEDCIKINSWLTSRHTTVLDGFGQHDHDRSEVFTLGDDQGRCVEPGYTNCFGGFVLTA
jgi:hypothetical protein